MSVLAFGTFECADIGAVLRGRGPDQAQAVGTFRAKRSLDRQQRRSDSIGLPVGHSATRDLGRSAIGVLITDKSHGAGCDEVHNAIKRREFLFCRGYLCKSTNFANSHRHQERSCSRRFRLMSIFLMSFDETPGGNQMKKAMAPAARNYRAKGESPAFSKPGFSLRSIRIDELIGTSSAASRSMTGRYTGG